MTKSPRILVVGSLNMDLIAETDRFPVPGQTLMGRRFSMAPGGKGANQAVQMARLGCDVTMLGKLGVDQNGQTLLQVCRDAGLNTEHMLFDHDDATGCAIIIPCSSSIRGRMSTTGIKNNPCLATAMKDARNIIPVVWKSILPMMITAFRG